MCVVVVPITLYMAMRAPQRPDTVFVCQCVRQVDVNASFLPVGLGTTEVTELLPFGFMLVCFPNLIVIIVCCCD